MSIERSENNEKIEHAVHEAIQKLQKEIRHKTYKDSMTNMLLTQAICESLKCNALSKKRGIDMQS